jgi:hypothetical protein
MKPIVLKIWFDKKGPSTKGPDLVLQDANKPLVEGGTVELSNPISENTEKTFTRYRVFSAIDRFELQGPEPENPSYFQWQIVVLEKL